MKALLTNAILLAAASTAPATSMLRADFSYSETTQTTGAREHISSTNLIKGNRRAILTKGHISIIDLDRETITDVDLSKKTYSMKPFAPMKTTDPRNFKVSVKSTGQSKSIGVLNAKEVLVTMTTEGADAAQEVTLDAWMATVPGYDEVKEFQRKLGEKLGGTLRSGRPETLPGFNEAGKQLNKLEGAPLQYTVKISGLMETKTVLTGFSAGPVDASKFEVPVGFQKVEPQSSRAFLR
jgi:hypothetical protein